MPGTVPGVPGNCLHLHRNLLQLLQAPGTRLSLVAVDGPQSCRLIQNKTFSSLTFDPDQGNF